jgi:hypothetical protein
MPIFRSLRRKIDLLIETINTCKLYPKMMMKITQEELSRRNTRMLKLCEDMKYVNIDLQHDGIHLSILSVNPNAVEWIEDKRFVPDYFYLSANPSAMHILEKNMNNINWYMFSKNNSDRALQIMKEMPGVIHFQALCMNTNPKVYELLLSQYTKIHWDMLSLNSADFAIDLLMDNPHKIDWKFFSANANPRAYAFLQKHPEKINHLYLSMNPNAVEWLKENPQYIDWGFLSRNENAIDFLEENVDKINWHELCFNPNATRLFKYATKHNVMKIPDNYIRNPQIFVYDYEKMRTRISCFKEELIQRVWCPANVLKWAEQGYDDFLES